MSQVREVIHDLINSATIAEGMAKILKNNVEGEEKQSFEENLNRLDKVITYLAKIQKDLATIREISRNNNW
ncbi:MAG: hypothetical protein ACOYL6_02015 [Bacteriovoracaceae bacterium]